MQGRPPEVLCVEWEVLPRGCIYDRAVKNPQMNNHVGIMTSTKDEMDGEVGSTDWEFQGHRLLFRGKASKKSSWQWLQYLSVMCDVRQRHVSVIHLIPRACTNPHTIGHRPLENRNVL